MVGATPDDPETVVSLLCFRDGSRAEVLLGVRRPTPFAPRHPGVLSTPTMTVPATVARQLLGDTPCTPGLRHFSATPRFRVGQGGYVDDHHAFVLEHLLARKLGLAGALVSGAFVAEAWLQALAVDVVEDPLGTQVSVWTAMLSYCAVLGCDPSAVPAASASYSKLFWAPAALVGEAVRNKAPLLLDITLDPFEVCIHGLCVRSAASILEA
jgi:hypothetical protein